MKEKYLVILPHVALILIVTIHLFYRHGPVTVMETVIGALAVYYLSIMAKNTLKKNDTNTD